MYTRKVKIVGHRGATDLLSENTVASLKEAENIGLDAIELDLRKTSDGKVVSVHDRSLYFTSGINKMVDEVTFAQLKKIGTKSGHPIPTLEEIVDAIEKTPLIFDIKEPGTAAKIVELMNKPRNRKKNWFVTSRIHSECRETIRLHPGAKVFMTAELQHPLHIVREAKEAGAYGITINIWTMNLLIYWLAKQAGLEVMIYIYKPRFILHNPTIVRLLRRFYPDMYICSDRADRLLAAFRQRPAQR